MLFATITLIRGGLMISIQEKIQLFITRFNGNKLAVEWYDKSGKKQWAPYCHNEFDRKLGCKKGEITGACNDCKLKDYSSWTEKSASNHIFGSIVYSHTGKRKSHGVYPLMPDGTVHFGAIDFDNRHTFLDVKDFYEACVSYGLEGHIARSTSKGWHIYFFFADPVLAKEFRAIVLFIMEAHSFDWACRPEIFPKQNEIRENEFGNLIKVPMILHQIEQGRNCFVSTQDVPTGNGSTGINIEKQWEYLKDTTLISRKTITDIIEINKINIDILAGPSYSASTTQINTKWTPPLSGDFIKILQNCPALKKVAQNPFDKDVNHEQRFALAMTAIRCKNGIEHLRSIFPAKQGEWNDKEMIDENGYLKGSKRVEEIILYAKEKNYKPWSCQKLKEIDACKNGKRCLEAKQVFKQENGHLVPIDGEFRLPSPIRFAYDKDTGVGLEELISMGKNCKGSDESSVLKLFMDNLIHITKLDHAKTRLVIDTFSKAGGIKASTLVSAMKAFQKEKKMSVGDLSFSFNGATYSVDIERKRYLKTVASKEDVKVHEITNFLTDLKEIRTQKDGEGREIVIYKGEIITPKGPTTFNINKDEWHNRRRLPQLIGQITNNKAMLEEKYTEDFLRCTQEFCDYKIKSVLTEFGYYGPDKATYYSPSVVIDKNGIRPNNKEQDMDLSGGRIVSQADLTILEEEEFKSVTRTFMDDILSLLEPKSVLPVFGYYFMIPVLGRFGGTDRKGNDLIQKPTLWLEGLQGTGKTSLAKLLNCLFGNFLQDGLKETWLSSYNFISKEGLQMKDLPFLVDDFKYNSLLDMEIASRVINNYYDSTGRRTLRRDGTYNTERVIKGYLVSTGEDIPKDASTISRCILVHFDPVAADVDKFRRCEKNAVNYKGITPYFIYYLYQYTNAELVEKINSMQDILLNKNGGVCDARITRNIACMCAGFWYFLDFVLRYNIITQTEFDDLWDKFMKSIDTIGERMFGETYQSQSSNMFLEILGSMIDSDGVKIKNYNDESTHNKQLVGFVEVENGYNPADEFVYIYPRAAYSEVVTFMRKTGDSLKHGIRAITTHLIHQKYIIKAEDGRSTVRKRREEDEGSKIDRVWVIKKSVLKMKDTLRMVKPSGPKKEDNPFYSDKD